MFKTEPHLHVAEISMCSKLKASEMVKLYKDAGVDTIFVSDHFMPRFFDSLGEIPWEDKVTIFLSGYYKAKVAGEKQGIKVLLSAEVSFDDSPNHYLVYGITKEFLIKHPDLCYKGAEHFSKIARENGIFVVQAHPYRDGECFPTPELVDAIEVYNGSPRHDDKNDDAEKLAKDNNLFETAGSDAHRTEDVAMGCVLTDVVITDEKQYIDIIKERNFDIYKG